MQCYFLQLFRKLSKELPARFEQDLALSLHYLGVRLSKLGYNLNALNITIEATSLYKKLADQHPEVFLPYVAVSLNNLYNRFLEFGQVDEARQIDRELIEIQEKLNMMGISREVTGCVHD